MSLEQQIVEAVEAGVKAGVNRALEQIRAEPDECLVKTGYVLEALNVSRKGLETLINKPGFPRPITAIDGNNRWTKSSINEWMRQEQDRQRAER